MNRIWLIALISILVGTVSCSKDDDKMVYTVMFETDGGTPVPSSQRVEEGNTATAPSTNPAKAGYAFVFWHLSGSTTAYNFQTPVNSNITLQAKWQEEATAEYWQVTWNLNGGSWTLSDNHATQVLKGGTLAEPNVPTKSGSTLEGWYKESILTNKVTFPYDVANVTADITLHAKWTTGGENPPTNNHKISSVAEWNAAVAAANAAGSNKTHTFTVTKSFGLPGTGPVTIFTKELIGIMVTIRGQGDPAPEISLDGRGYLIYLAPQEPQKIVLENIVLKGGTSNNAAVLGVKNGGELVIGDGAVITGNTNTGGGGGGVDVGSKLILDGGKITGNVSGTAGETNGHGGGVFMDNMSEFIMESGNISGNKVYGQGGGVHVDLFARFTVKGGNIFGNTAWAASSGARGGGVYNVGGTFRMSGGKIAGYDWAHGNEINIPEHYSYLPEVRDNCNSVVIGATPMGIYGAALYSPSGGDNLYGTSEGETFTQTGEFGHNIHIDRDIEIVDGVRANRFDVNGELYSTYRGGMDYWGKFFNDKTENIFLGLTTIYGEWIALDMLVPAGKDRLVAGTYTFAAAGASVAAYTFVDNDYTSFVQDADGNKLKMTGGTVKISVMGIGDNAVYTIAVESTLENGDKVTGTYHGTLEWYNRTGE